ncbi:MAG TPA: glycogen debranching protein GlgX [Oscillatoriales cyanobacterium M4454_W2019_049]|nr:glycogen debranching protein GlgX [Oscillatoriales cyanobacterium M4454_W2019_049]
MYEIEPGHPHPLGALPDAAGVNFSLLSQHATIVELLLFGEYDQPFPEQVITLNPEFHKTFYYWHVYVKGLKPGTHYAYRVDGPRDIHQGHRFDRNKVLVDPYAKGLTKTYWSRIAACGGDSNLETSMRGVVIDLPEYDWEGDRPLNRPMNETIIYEMHVRGFTQSSSADCRYPGTFLSVIEKIPYLQNLGITAVELLPVFDFDETEIYHFDPKTAKPLRDYWGYNPISFFCPQSSYCAFPEQGGHIQEFRDMVKALHKAGIEVILDVVYNHTGEGNHLGPTINFKGLDNSVYYYLWSGDKQYYQNYSGCGNTLKCNHPIVTKLILDSLEFWVKEMHVDGFRFDEGSILSRGEDGAPMDYPTVLWMAELSDTLADTKIIAEAWDAGGLYQVGGFPGYRWAEWNGRFRDDVRRFVRGDAGLVGQVAQRIAGSADLYQSTGRLPINSINYITCHDGFTLNDLVSYNEKHNEANGENNQDGIDENFSWNCGVEGETDDPDIEALRQRQIKNFFTLLMVSQGVPMIAFGDEIRRTQKGNNNAYCQDNEISWFDWHLVEKNADMLRFFQQMIRFRQRHAVLRRNRFFEGKVNPRGLADISWHGCKLYSPGWSDPVARALSFTLGGDNSEADLHIMLNMDAQALYFEVPPIYERQWVLAVDTAKAAPEDIVLPGQEHPLVDANYLVTGRSSVILISK